MISFARYQTLHFVLHRVFSSNNFSDHHPYFLCLDAVKHNHPPPKRLKIYTETHDTLNKFYEEIKKQNIINHINRNPFSNPNANYQIMKHLLTMLKKNIYQLDILSIMNRNIKSHHG